MLKKWKSTSVCWFSPTINSLKNNPYRSFSHRNESIFPFIIRQKETLCNYYFLSILICWAGETPLERSLWSDCPKGFSDEEDIISLLLFCCAKRSILPRKTETSEKRVRSFYGQNSTAQRNKSQVYNTPSFWRFLAIRYRVFSQRLFPPAQQISGDRRG